MGLRPGPVHRHGDQTHDGKHNKRLGQPFAKENVCANSLLIKELESSALQEIPGGEDNQQTDPGALLPAGGTIRVQLYLRVCLGHGQCEALVPRSR